MPMKNTVRRPAARVQFVAGLTPAQRVGIRAPDSDPVRLLELKRADTAACAGLVQGIAQKLGADRSITEQNQQHEAARGGVSLAAEQCLGDRLASALDECSSAARASGLTGAALRADAVAAKEAVLLGGQCWQLARGAREASFVLGHGALAALDVSRDGLALVINQGGAPDVVAAARADYERIDAPLAAEAQRRVDKAQGTARDREAQDGAVAAATERARFDDILAALRAGNAEELAADDVLWAHAYHEAHVKPAAVPNVAGAKPAPSVAAPPPASNRRGKPR